MMIYGLNGSIEPFRLVEYPHLDGMKCGLPSGKLTVCYGKSPSLIGKSTN